MRKEEKQVVGITVIALAIVIVAAIFVLHPFAITTTSQQNGAACTTLQVINCGQQVGGTVTAISEVQFLSNYAALNGPAWLVSFVLNGNGQYLFGSSNNQIAKAVNSSYSGSTTPISINAKINSQNLVIPYSYSGQNLALLSIEPIAFQFGWFSAGAGLATACNQQNQSGTGNTYIFACLGPASAQDEQNVFIAYNNDCTGAQGSVFASAVNVGGIMGYGLQCYSVISKTVGQVFQAGSPTIAENVSVVYTNATGSKSIYLTTALPEGNFNNQVFANIYGYDVGSLNTYIGTTSPTLVVITSTNNPRFLNPATTTDIATLNQLPSTAYQSAGIAIEGVPFTYLYNLASLQNAISQQNTNVNNYLQESLQPTSPFANIQAAGYYLSYTGIPIVGAAYYGIINVTTNPVYYPEIQFIAPLVYTQSLGVVAPVSMPKIVAEMPNPLVVQSGASATATFTVISNVSGPAFIKVFLQSNSTQVAQSPSFAVGPSPTQVQLGIPAYSKNLANTGVTYIAQACSTTVAECTNFTFSGSIKPNCPAGSVYVNNTSCQAETHSCDPGFAYNGTGCSLICTPPLVFQVNATTGQGVCAPPPPPTSSSIPIGYIIVGIIIVIVIVSVIAVASKRKHPHAKIRMRRRA